MGRPPRRRDGANLAEVPTAPVSMVRNGVSGYRVAPATRNRIRAAAAKIGYRPNGLTRSLRLQISATIAFVSHESATTPFAGHPTLGAQEWAAPHPKPLMLAITRPHRELEA